MLCDMLGGKVWLRDAGDHLVAEFDAGIVLLPQASGHADWNGSGAGFVAYLQVRIR
jgi:hypothetical protein